MSDASGFPPPPGGQFPPPPPSGYPPPPTGGGLPPGPPAKKPIYKRTWFIVSAVLLVLVVVGSAASGSKDDEQDATGSTTTIERATATEVTTTTVDPDTNAIKDGNVARCNDGGYSDNHDFAATCSGGDGIDKWLAPFGECQDGTVIKMSAKATCQDNEGFKKLLPVGYRPEAADGDIARCKDTTFSDNTDFAAACSSHGGVSKWLAPYGKCKDSTVIKLSTTASCEDHNGFQALLPESYVPPTTTTTAPPPPPPSTTPPATSPPAPAESVSQSNARQSAADYLDYSAFSRSGLIKQLAFEGFSTADATYGVDALGADWNEQAAKSAASYLEYSSFSRSGLIDQLVFEGFTRAQAEFGVSTTGL